MSLILAFGRSIVRFFFREMVIEGRDRLPASGPVIFTPNHPNGLIDPLLLLFLSPPLRLHFVAKAPLFRIPVFGSILRSIGAIPVMRKMDAAGEVDYTTFFASCVDALVAGGSIVIFPEGRSLPQSHLAPMKTGPARLFFLAREKGANVSIVPVGLNYERGSIFRSRVLVALAPPLEASVEGGAYKSDPVEAVRALTEKIGSALDEYVIQAQTYRDRELMLLLERLYGEVPEDRDWRARFARLKLFEEGLSQLSTAEPARIDKIRALLSRYERLSGAYRPDNTSQQSWLLLLMPPAAIGWLLNAIPYKLVDLIVQRHDASEAATFKVVYSLFAFPIAYVIEAIAIAHFFGTMAAIVFAIVILPLSYFSQKMSDWWEEYPILLTGSKRDRLAQQLTRLRSQITNEVDMLAESLRTDGGR